jgi:hypothetical protein
MSETSIKGAIAAAAHLTGVSASLLLRTAERESSLRPDAKAQTSSATGLFQFVERTWLDTLSRYGEAHGLGEIAAQAGTVEGRAQALKLRHDPEASALMAGALTAENAQGLKSRLGRDASDAELYAAHVLGVSGAARLVEALQETPAIPAHQLFEKAARANPSLFNHKDGSPRSVESFWQRLTKGFDGEAAPAMAQPVSVQTVNERPLTPNAVAWTGFHAHTSMTILADSVIRTLAELHLPLTSEEPERLREEETLR